MKVIQPKKLFKALGVKDYDEAEKVLSAAFGFLLYLKPGQALETAYGRFEKIADDLIHVDTTLNLEGVVDALQREKVIKFPG